MTLEVQESTGLDAARERFVSVMPDHLERLTWSAGQVETFQTERLRALLTTAIERSPYHARRLAGIDPAGFSLDDLATLPVMTKAEMMAHYDQVVTDRRLTRSLAERHLSRIVEGAELLMDRYFVLASGGSSGVRGLFAWDRDAAVEFFCAVLRSGLRQVAAMMGWPPARPLPIVLAAAPTGMHATRALMTLAEGAVAMPVFAPATLPFDEVVERVNAAQPMLIAGYTSTVARLADARAAGSLTATPQMVVVTSEQLTPELSDRIARGFGAPPANNFASTEGLIGAAPPGSDVFDFASDLAIVEFVDAEDRPVSVGEPADHVLVTNLANVTQPLIRYRLDDRMVEAEPSPLHGHQRARLDGRNDAYMDLGGVQIHPLSLRSALLKHPEIIEYQVFHGAGGLRVDIVPGGPVDSARLEREIAAVLVAAGANGIDVTIRPVDAVRRDPGTGKARRFIAS